MSWNWESPQWPNFQWDQKKLLRAEQLFIESAGVLSGALRHISDKNQQALSIELMSIEALDSSEIEGETLNRESVQSSIRRELGLTTNQKRAMPSEIGMAEMMVDLYQTLPDSLTQAMLFNWHRSIMKGRYDLENIGSYRTYAESMQIVSGPDYARRVKFEAPPSSQVPSEMQAFLTWFEKTSPQSKKRLPIVTRAGIAHLWFESIHPFEDGNGRIGRAVAEKALSQHFSAPFITVLAKVLLKRRKEYYEALGVASKCMEITDWLLWFASAVIEAQKNTLIYIDFIINKAKFMDRLRDQLNTRQEKVLLRMLKEGPEGFKGGLSAANYLSITGASTATTTRDLHDLVEKAALIRTGEKKSTRYFLAMKLGDVKTITVEDIL